MRISTTLFYQQATDAMLDRQSDVAKTELQLATGKRILKPSDDPTATSRIMELDRSVDSIAQYQNNIDYTTSRLEQEEGVLDGAVNVLQRINELSIQGNNATTSASDKRTIALEIHSFLDSLLGIANTQDANGEYLFGGFQRDTEPFVRSALNTFVYAGDQGQRTLQVSPTRQVSDGDTGFDIFVDIDTGPFVSVAGVAATSFAAINSGDLTINGINVGAIPAAADAAERATQLNQAINLVADSTNVRSEIVGGNTISLSSSTGDIVINAISTPDTGLTTGTYAASTSNRNLFETVYQLATALEGSGSVDRYIGDLQLAMNKVLDVRSTVGARLNVLDGQGQVNETAKLVLETRLSDVQDLDYTEAITRMNQQMVALQAAQKSYVQVQGSTLFDYL